MEGAVLVGGWLGEDRHVGAGAGEADLVAGEGGQVIEQAAEAAQRVAGFVALGAGLGVGGRGALCGGDWVVPVGGCSSVNVIGAQALRRRQTR